MATSNVDLDNLTRKSCLDSFMKWASETGYAHTIIFIYDQFDQVISAKMYLRSACPVKVFEKPSQNHSKIEVRVVNQLD